MKYLQIVSLFLAQIKDSSAITLHKKHDLEVIAGPPNSELTSLDQHGVPVFVVPTLLMNTEARTDLLQRDITIDGVNGFDFV